MAGKFRYHLYLERFNHGNSPGAVSKVAKFEDKAQAKLCGETLVAKLDAYSHAVYTRYFIIDKGAE